MRFTGRKRKQSITLATFDLRSEYVGGRPDNSGEIEIDCPVNGGKILVFRKLRDDPLGRMQDRRQISEAQYLAGRRWQKAYETAEISGAQAIDPTREYVDGGQIARSAVTDEQAKAFAVLARSSKVLGMIGESVIRDVLAHRMTMGQIAQARGEPSDRSVKYYGRVFRDGLDVLAVEFGYSNRRVG